ncbi:MAG TPA: hypothetical protein VJS12_01750 [Steroidobacteraceae bacterium]|nr:hypothetical protein [Steroidobacteraceae bacterium]
MKLSHAFALTCSFVLSTAAASSANAANPAAVAFKTETNVSLYGKPTGLMITGRCNRYDAPFMTMRTKGGEVLAYLNPTSRPDGHVCDLDRQFYMNNYGAVPLWPWPSYGQRQIYANSRMADIRKGTVWSNYVVAYAEKLMRERKVDGIFLDVVGARPWGISNWTNWSKTEKDAWTNGTVDLVRRIDAKRRAINPNFLLLNNNIWDRGDGSTLGYPAEKFVDGVILEHPPGVTAYHSNYVKRAFSNLGHRRVMIIARNTTEAKAWALKTGVTHVSNQTSSQYAYPTVPPISFKALSDR